MAALSITSHVTARRIGIVVTIIAALALGQAPRASAATGGIISTIAGSGGKGFSGDGGPATAAQLNIPSALAVAPDGSVVVADTDNERIRRVSPDGVITTIAGTGVAGFSGDGGPATSAQVNEPRGIAVAGDGSVIIADYNNNRLRRVGVDGIITTIAGTSTFGFSGDGGRRPAPG
jgi:serine/threonine-protein kinase